MKKNKLTVFAILVLALAMASMMLVSGTFAKYAKEYSGSSSATVAHFEVGSISTASLELFSTIKEADATTTESDVVSGKIAPGTGGQFTITVSNSSEVAVRYTMQVTETSNTSNVPIEYSVDGTTYYTAADFSSVATDTLAIGSTTPQSDSVTVYWRWAFTGADSDNYTATQTDATDTALGEAASAPTVTVQVKAIYEQID